MPLKTYKNNIFEVITHIDKKDYNYFKSLSEDCFEELQPYTILRWMSVLNPTATKKQWDEYTLKMNKYSNEKFFEKSKWKDLQMQLLCAAGSGKYIKHAWIKPSAKKKVDKNYEALRSFYKHLSDEEYEMKYNSMSKSEIKDLQGYLGLLDK